jgi:hypothetical protein
MIVEYVLFKTPPGMTREQVLESARTTVPRWQANKELISKHYIESEDRYGGAFYVWPSKAAAEHGHDAAWRAGVAQRTGFPPTIRYFDLLMVLDNQTGKVTEFPATGKSAEAAE